MAKEIIKQIMDVEASCDVAIEEATKKAETIKSEAKVSSKKYYEDAVAKVQGEYEEKIKKATEDAKLAIENADKEAEKEQEELAKTIKAKEDKAIAAVLDTIIR